MHEMVSTNLIGLVTASWKEKSVDELIYDAQEVGWDCSHDKWSDHARCNG